MAESRLKLAKPPESTRAHLVVGGFPPGNHAGHDMDYARLKLLSAVAEHPSVRTSVSSDFDGLERFLPGCQLLITYTAGPYLDDAANQLVRDWLAEGGRWLALHGTSGGRHEPDPERPGARRMMTMPFHETLGSHFMHHPLLQRYRVDVTDPDHPLAKGLPSSFEITDEPYFVDLLGDEPCRIFLTTDMPKDPTPEDLQLVLSYDHEKALLPDGRSRVVAYTKQLGKGAVGYIAMGHCHSKYSCMQPAVDESIDPEGKTPSQFSGPWENADYQLLLRNAIDWGLSSES